MHGWLLSLVLGAMTSVGCAAAQARAFEATSPDGIVRFELTEREARAAFSSACDLKAECDSFENYRIRLTLDTGFASLTFVHESVGRVPLSEVRFASILCAYSVRGRRCWSEGSE